MTKCRWIEWFLFFPLSVRPIISVFTASHSPQLPLPLSLALSLSLSFHSHYSSGSYHKTRIDEGSFLKSSGLWLYPDDVGVWCFSPRLAPAHTLREVHLLSPFWNSEHSESPISEVGTHIGRTLCHFHTVPCVLVVWVKRSEMRPRSWHSWVSKLNFQ